MWKKLVIPLLLLFVIFFSSCGPNEFESMQTQNAIVEKSNAQKTVRAATQAAQPTRTKGPTAKPDNRSPFDKCRSSNRGVRYVVSVTSGNVNGASLTLQNDTGGTDQGDYKVPLCVSYNFQSGDFVYLSAQIILPTDGAGAIKCEIWDGANKIAQASASGFASIATCSGVVP